MDERIPIVMVCDSEYVSQTRVAIWTMRKSTCKDVRLDITIICSDQLNVKERDRLVKLELMLPNLKIKFYEVDLNTFIMAKSENNIPITSFFRLIIPQALDKEKKCLFLDGDIIVNTDLQNLYLQEINDVYIAGVRDNEFLYNPESAIRHFKDYGFEYMNSYINAGVLVLNLVKIREDGLQARFLETMKAGYPYMDQDILNYVCGKKIKLLNLKYNYFNRRKNMKVEMEQKELTEKCQAQKEKWEILHFTGSYKPWRNLRIRNAREWWIWAKEALEETEYNKIYSKAREMTIQYDWSYVLSRCEKEKIIIIVGYSNIGIDIYISLKRCGIKAAIYFCDNSLEKQNLSDSYITIYPVTEMVKRYSNALWINASQSHYTEISMQLEKAGIKDRKILIYKDKGREYFEMIDDSYLEYEIAEMRLKSTGNLSERK